MLRWLGRLLLIGLILGAIGFAVSRLLGQDDDFDDFDDIEEGFEYTETPVEIDVPADSSTGSGADSGSASQSYSTDGATTAASQGGSDARTESTAGAAADSTADSSGDNSAAQASLADGATGAEAGEQDDASAPAAGDTGTAGSEIGLQEIKGIGPAYEQSLIALGINNVNELVGADATQLSEQLNVIGGQSEVEDWISQARDLTSGSGAEAGAESNP